MDRVILHCDMNSFFASVELLEHPELRSKPVAVCGDPDSRHGIILAKNEAAKKYGIKTAETIWQARKKCPGLVLLPPHMNKYKHYSQELNKIYQRYTDLVEPFSIDESWMDVTASLNLFGSGRQIADEIRQTVKKELGLTLSAGNHARELQRASLAARCGRNVFCRKSFRPKAQKHRNQDHRRHRRKQPRCPFGSPRKGRQVSVGARQRD